MKNPIIHINTAFAMIVYDGICARRWFDQMEREFAVS